jgi:hypothetical protein
MDANAFILVNPNVKIKTRIQEHIGEVTKLYAKNILITDHSQTTNTPPSQPSQTQSEAQSTSSFVTQEEISSMDSIDDTKPLWVVINNNAFNTPPPLSTKNATTKSNAT